MKDGPLVAHIAALIGDPARANILTALMGGKALTVSELAEEAGVTLQTTSTHLAKLRDGNLVVPRKQGRHRYFALASPQVAQTIEALMCLAADRGIPRTRTGPRDEALRFARRCYNHLAGTSGVQMYESLIRRGYLTIADAGLTLSPDGYFFAEGLGIDVPELAASRTPLCRECLDWSERKTHLAGSLARAFLDHMIAHRWVVSHETTRALTFTPNGSKRFNAAFPADWKVSG